jgi:hypothetical protein
MTKWIKGTGTGVSIYQTQEKVPSEKTCVSKEDDGAVILESSEKEKTGKGGNGKTIQSAIDEARRKEKKPFGGIIENLL